MTQEIDHNREPATTPGGTVPSPDLNHELRTFLHTIIGYIEILQEDAAAQGQANLGPELEKILEASNHLAALVEEQHTEATKRTDDSSLEPTSLSRENAGKWLRDRIFSPSQEQSGLRIFKLP